MVTETVIKICPDCGKDSAMVSFEKYANAKPKSKTRKCDDCYRAYMNKRMKEKYSREGYNDKMREYYKERQARHPEKCREIRRKTHLKRAFGLTVAAYEEMEARQGGRCAVCKRIPEKRLSVDHCHRTGLVRALLCGSCNRAIGLFGEDLTRLASAVEYLKKHGR